MPDKIIQLKHIEENTEHFLRKIQIPKVREKRE